MLRLQVYLLLHSCPPSLLALALRSTHRTPCLSHLSEMRGTSLAYRTLRLLPISQSWLMTQAGLLVWLNKMWCGVRMVTPAATRRGAIPAEFPTCSHCKRMLTYLQGPG